MTSQKGIRRSRSESAWTGSNWFWGKVTTPSRLADNPNLPLLDTPEMKYLDVEAIVASGLCRSRFAVYRCVKRGTLPKPIRVAGRMLWLEATILALGKP